MPAKPKTASPADLAPALEFLQAQGFKSGRRVALILGSGLGEVEAECSVQARVDYAQVPGLPLPTGLAGHVCRLTSGRLFGADTLVFRGRYHAYEGFAPRELAMLPRIAHGMGARTLVITNAAGSIRRDLRPGALLAITDHINLMGLNPLAGRERLPGAARFAPMAGAYDAALVDALIAAGKAAGEPVRTGVYAGVLGPSFETAAEVRALGAMGADCVGMSTVPEAIVAHALGMRVCGLSLITNRAGQAGDSHEDTLRQAVNNAPRMASVLRGLFSSLK